MATAVATRPISYVFDFGGPIEFELPEAMGLNQHLTASAPTTWVWCLRCERSFELASAREAGGAVKCCYADCDGRAPDFWSWQAFRSFAALAPLRPRLGERYPLAG